MALRGAFLALTPARPKRSATTSLALLVAATMSFIACSRHAAPVPTTTAGTEEPPRVPTQLLDADAMAADAFADARAGDWTKASETLPEIEARLFALEGKAARRGDGAPWTYAPLREAIGSLRRAIEGRERVASMRAAADVSLAAGEIQARMRGSVPVLVPRMARVGRSLLVALEAGDRDAADRAIGQATRTWETLRPQIASRGGRALATKTDRTLDELRAARSPDELQGLAEDLVEEADTMGSLFD